VRDLLIRARGLDEIKETLLRDRAHAFPNFASFRCAPVGDLTNVKVEYWIQTAPDTVLTISK
jgi:hypothetical protein